MDIVDVDSAKLILSNVNYYRLTGYAFQFKDKENPDDYLPGTKLDKIWCLYQFDAKLRCILKPFLDIVELHARTKIAYSFALEKCRSSPHDQHYDSANFFNKESHVSIISSLVREKTHNKDSLFVIHHTNKYGGKMPVWVLVELLSFTNLSKFYSAMYISEQRIIAESMGTTSQTLKNHLHCMANLRNKIAHASRLYNASYNPPVMLGRKYLRDTPDIRPNTLFAYLVALLRRIPSKKDRSTLVMTIINAVIQYSDCVELPLMGFPDEYITCLCNEIR